MVCQEPAGDGGRGGVGVTGDIAGDAHDAAKLARLPRARADVELVERFRRARNAIERERVFKEVFDEHYRVVLAYCARELWTDLNAGEDAVQETFLVAFMRMAD